MKLKLGASTPYNVLVAQNNVQSAELAEAQTRVAYANALVEMDRATGTIVQKGHIDISEALTGGRSKDLSSAAIH